MRKLRYLALSSLGGNSTQYRAYDDILVHQEVRVKWWARELGRASKRAKQVFFDKILCRAHLQLIFNYVAWTRPRRLDASVQIKRADGTVIEDPDELKEEFKEKFTPSVPKPVDMSILDETPSL